MKKFLLAFVFLCLMASPAFSTPVTFFGEDLGLGESTPLTAWPNALAAETAFLSNLVGVGTETFESYTTGTGADLAINFPGAGTATLTGDGSIATVTSGTNGFGRYPISGVNYWETGSSFTINFDDPIAAFGFYGVDVGDFDGQLTLTMESGETTEIIIPNSIDILGGSVIYFGFYDLEDQYTSITFGNTAAGVDYFGFDNMTIGSLEQVVPSVPEPATMLLLGTGLLGLAALRRRFKK